MLRAQSRLAPGCLEIHGGMLSSTNLRFGIRENLKGAPNTDFTMLVLVRVCCGVFLKLLARCVLC